MLKAAGKLDAARAAEAKATKEIDAKAHKLRDPELRKVFLASRQRTT